MEEINALSLDVPSYSSQPKVTFLSNRDIPKGSILDFHIDANTLGVNITYFNGVSDFLNSVSTYKKTNILIEKFSINGYFFYLNILADYDCMIFQSNHITLLFNILELTHGEK